MEPGIGHRLVSLAYDLVPWQPVKLFWYHAKNADEVHREFLAWLDGRSARNRPFFAFLNDFDAHEPYLVPPEANPRHFGRAPQTYDEIMTLMHWPHVSQPEHVAHRALANDAYDDCIASLDRRIGRLWTQLDRRGVLDNTVLIVVSDHGESIGEHGLYGHRLSVYRQEVEVPLLMVGPGVPSGETVDAPVSLRDLPATIADLTGLGDVAPFPGRSLARFWTPGGGALRPTRRCRRCVTRTRGRAASRSRPRGSTTSVPRTARKKNSSI